MGLALVVPVLPFFCFQSDGSNVWVVRMLRKSSQAIKTTPFSVVTACTSFSSVGDATDLEVIIMRRDELADIRLLKHFSAPEDLISAWSSGVFGFPIEPTIPEQA